MYVYSVKYNFDVFITLCHAPGQSAFNPVERRMPPLSTELAGVVLPHEHFGSHLKTPDWEPAGPGFESRV